MCHCHVMWVRQEQAASRLRRPVALSLHPRARMSHDGLNQPLTCDNLTMSANKTLSQTELDNIEILCGLAHGANSKQQQLTHKSDDPQGRPLRLQNLTLPARVSACRVVLDMANGGQYRASLQKWGLTHLEFEAIRHKDHNFALVVEAAKRVRDALQVADAQNGLNRLITEDGCELNAKAVMFAAERLDPKRYGKATDENGSGSAPKTIYNIVINATPTGQSCGNIATTPIDAEVIGEIPHE